MTRHERLVMWMQGVHLPLSITNLCLPYQLLPFLLACAVCIQHVSRMYTAVPSTVRRIKVSEVELFAAIIGDILVVYLSKREMNGLIR